MNGVRLFSFACLLVTLAACQNESLAPLIASDVEITPPLPTNRMSAGYLSLQNTTEQDIVISAVTSDAYASVEIHESSVENGIAKMRKLASLTVPAGAKISLQRGGIHLMLRQPRDIGDDVSLTFLSGSTPLLDITTGIARTNESGR